MFCDIKKQKVLFLQVFYYKKVQFLQVFIMHLEQFFPTLEHVIGADFYSIKNQNHLTGLLL